MVAFLHGAESKAVGDALLLKRLFDGKKIWMIWRPTQSAVEHPKILVHLPESSGKRAFWVHFHQDIRRVLAQQGPAQQPRPAGGGHMGTGARLHQRAEYVVVELWIQFCHRRSLLSFSKWKNKKPGCAEGRSRAKCVFLGLV